MRNSRRLKGFWMVMAAASLATPVFAQVPAQNQDGRAADANNRVGSGGLNEPGRGIGARVSPNSIIYGNVTGGKQFTGPAERDPSAFSGPIPGRGFDRFIAGSSSAPLPYQPGIDLSTPQPFYGSSRGVAPPIGSVRLGFTDSYLGTDLTSQTPSSFTIDNSAGLQALAQPLGESVILGGRGYRLGTQPGQVVLQGTLESANQEVLYTGSPLYGVRQLQPGTFPTEADLFDTNVPGGAANTRYRVPNSEIERMRDELIGRQPGTSPQSQQDQQQNNTQSRNPSDLSQPPESPENAAIDTRRGGAINPNVLSNTSDERVEQRSTVTGQGQTTNDQYNELKRRFQRYQNPQMAAIEANHQLQMEQRRQTTERRTNGPTSRPISPLAAKGMLHRPGGGPLTEQTPLKIDSLATGVTAKGLHQLLSSAEKLMRQDKFQSAIDAYNTAESVDPNNALIPLGRANAELGAGFYRLSSADLHKVFLTNGALLMGQYDLNAWMTPQRIKFITNELQTLANNDPKAEMPVFLLAYLYYNTDHPAEAAKYLAEAEQRSNGKDPLLQLLQERWKLPTQAPANAPDLNK